MNGFLISLQFLTQVPVPNEPINPNQLADSYYFYPLIGFLVGAAAVVLRRILMMIFPIPFSIVLVLAFLIWISGGLHEDGLADVADGMGGGWTQADRLRIMKDSRIGAFGASMLMLAILAKYSALTSMNPARLDASLVIAQMLGRWAFLPMGNFNRYAHEGLGSEFMKGLTPRAVVVATVVTLAAVILVGRVHGLIALASAVLIIMVASLYFRRRIGGVTGDCFGATFQFVEIATYAAFLA